MEKEDIKKRRDMVRDKVRNFYTDNKIGMEEILMILVEDATYHAGQAPEESHLWDFWNVIGELLEERWEVCEGKSLKIFWKEEKDKKYLTIEFS